MNLYIKSKSNIKEDLMIKHSKILTKKGKGKKRNNFVFTLEHFTGSLGFTTITKAWTIIRLRKLVAPMAIADAILTNAMILWHVASQTFEPFLLFVIFPCLGKCAQF